MAKKKKGKSKFRQKLLNKYRLVILNEDTFEEKISFKLTRLNVFIVGGLFSIILIISTIYLIAFTGIREYIPGYSSTALKREATTLVYKVDSLQQVLDLNNRYLQNVKKVLTGEIKEVHFDTDSVMQVIQANKDSVSLDPSNYDLEFRNEVESIDRYSIFNEAVKKTDIVFFAPVNGIISDRFNLRDKHYAIDIAVEMGTPVKAVADGTVIFAEWTAETGHVVILEHRAGFISVYKHNISLNKRQGDMVKSGEVIASAGSSGEYSTGPHLHFELWSDGYPVDPEKYIDFE